MQFFRFCKPSVPSTPKNDFLPISSEKSFYFITDISRQVCPLILQNYFPPHPKRTKFWLIIRYANVNFLLIFLAPEKPNRALMIPLTLQRSSFSLSYYNVHFFFKKQVSNQKIFCLQTKRTFFQRMDTPTIVKFLLTVSHTPLSRYNVHFFRKNQGTFKKSLPKT